MHGANKMKKIKLQKNAWKFLIEILVILMCILGTYAVVSHNFLEISAPTGCTSGQILKWTGNTWSCVSPFTANALCLNSNCKTSWDWNNDSLGNVYYTAGKVGIGISTPSEKLTVGGDIYVQDTIQIGWTTGSSCTSSNAGMIQYIYSSSGTTSSLKICMRISESSYDWFTIKTSS